MDAPQEPEDGARGQADGLGVYVHLPFCERVCPYCDFAVVAARPLAAETEARYVDALLAELALRGPGADGSAGERPRLRTLYFGGGTPSLLSPASIARLVAGVRDAFAPDPPRQPREPRQSRQPDRPAGAAAPLEITLEVNPSTVERERLPAFREAGVTRLSVGVQSFDDTVLRALGRAHRAEEAHRTLAATRAAGFDNVSVDLIFAAPAQRLASLDADLNALVAFGPEHVSTYELIIEPGTPFELAAGRGQLVRADEDEGVAMMEHIDARLAAAGLARYELASYARPGFESVHNSRYWQRRPVLGLGLGAHSSEAPGDAAPHGVRTANVRDLPTYLARLEAGQSPEATREVLGLGTARGEAVFLALRLSGGLRAAAFVRDFGAPPRAFFAGAIERLVGEGLLLESGAGDLRLSEAGRWLADAVSEGFVEVAE